MDQPQEESQEGHSLPEGNKVTSGAMEVEDQQAAQGQDHEEMIEDDQIRVRSEERS
jgi:hypothetical protein